LEPSANSSPIRFEFLIACDINPSHEIRVSSLSSHSQEVIDHFEALLIQEQIEARQGVIRFPERLVKVIFATQRQL